MMISQPEQGLENPLDAIAATLHGRRSFLQLGGAGIAAAAIRPNRNGAGSGQSGKQRSTERLVRRLFDAVESGSTSAIWDFFALTGPSSFPSWAADTPTSPASTQPSGPCSLRSPV